MSFVRPLLLLLSLFALSACAPRPVFVTMPEAATIGSQRQVLVATSRARDDDGLYRIRRSTDLGFLSYDVSIPPDHTTGEIEFPNKRPDPQKHFLLSKQTDLSSGAGFKAALNRALAKLPPRDRETIIFVHGFNNAMTEGVYRTAQLSHDFGLDGVAIHYSWPSAQNPLGYGYDRDSMLFARDGFEKLLKLVAQSGSRRTLVVAHSMGALLTMETLRQAPKEARNLGGVFLISPDIDVEVFRSQAQRIGKLPQPFVIFTSQKDRALRLSARLTGQSDRLGTLADPMEVAGLEVTLLDVTSFSGNGLNHFVTGDSPALIKLISQLRDVEATFRGDRAGRAGLIPGTVLTVQNATQIILQPIRR